jgi:hypothetical protein
MQLPNNDFNEEMHVLVYEITDGDAIKELGFDENEYTNVFSTYTTSSHQSMIEPCENVFAIYPKVQGLQDFVDTMGMQHKVVNNSVEDIQTIFKAIDFDKWIYEDILYGTRNGKCVPNNTTKIQTEFTTERNAFQQLHEIRFALVGGLHRCGLLQHMLGNYVIHNGNPLPTSNKTYTFNGGSSFNCKVPVHIIAPHSGQLKESILQACRDFSKIIQERKNESFVETIKSQMYLLLSKPNTEIYKMNEKRYIQHTYWTKDEVSSMNVLQTNYFQKKMSLTEYFL